MYKLSLKLDTDIQQKLISFGEDNYLNTDYFNPNGPIENGRFCHYVHTTESVISDLVLELYHNTYQQLNIDSLELEPYLGVFMNVNTEGAFIHKHIDEAPDGFHHLRINYLISKPYEGGDPILNDTVLDIDECECWINIASQWVHGSTPVVGNKKRMIISLGSLVSINNPFFKPYEHTYNFLD